MLLPKLRISSRHLAARHNISPFASSFRYFSEKKPHIIVALGGNALLKRGQPMTILNQRKNIAIGLSSLLPIIEASTITLVHGNGPQVGLLALQDAAYQSQIKSENSELDLDVLDAETEGMIGYLIEQELSGQLGSERGMVTVLSQIIVDQNDPAFKNPTKFIGPIYSEEEAKSLNSPVKRDGDYWRKVVPSPQPIKMLEHQQKCIRLLTDHDCVVICAGGGGIPVVEDVASGRIKGVNAVIDKDRAATMLGMTLNADGLLILTDVFAVATSFGTPRQRWIKCASPEQLNALMDNFPDGSMKPKVESCVAFVHQNGGWGAIGSLVEANKVFSGDAGTFVTNEYGPDHIEYYDNP